MSTPCNLLDTEWEIELKKLLCRVTPIEFALYGKDICFKLINMVQKCSMDFIPEISSSESSSSIDIPQYDHYIGFPRVSSFPIKLNDSIQTPPSRKNGKTTKIHYEEYPDWLPTIPM